MKIKNLSYGYTKCPSKHLIRNLNFSVENGKIQLIYGKSGLGKSTLLKLISGVGCEKVFWNGKITFEKKLGFSEFSQRKKTKKKMLKLFSEAWYTLGG